MKKTAYFLCILFVLSAVMGGCVDKKSGNAVKEKISIASMPFSFTGYTLYVAEEKGFFDDEGLDVTFNTPFNNGMETLNGMLEGKADFAVSSETPFIHTIINGKAPYLVASMISAEKHLSLAARSDKGILDVEDLKGKKIGVTIGSNGEYFLDSVMLLNRIDEDAVTIVDVKPKDMYDAITEGRVDAVATWNPQLLEIKNSLGGDAVLFDTNGMYSANFILSTSEKVIETRTDVIKKMLNAIIRATGFINTDKEAANKIVEKYLHLTPDLLGQLSAEYYFNISLSQSLLAILDNQKQWIINNKGKSTASGLVFRDYIYLDALEEINPERVTITNLK